MNDSGFNPVLSLVALVPTQTLQPPRYDSPVFSRSDLRRRPGRALLRQALPRPGGVLEPRPPGPAHGQVPPR